MAEPLADMTPLPASELRRRLIESVATHAEIASDDIDERTPLSRYSIDSVRAAAIAADIAELTNRTVKPDLLFEYPSIAELAAFLTGSRVRQATPAETPTQSGTSNEWSHVRLAGLRRLLRFLFRCAARIGMRVEHHGLENLPDSGPYIVAINHISPLDAPLTLLFLPTPIVLLIADRIARRPWVRILFAPSRGFIPIQRDSLMAMVGGSVDLVGTSEALRRAVEALRSGLPVGIAPEGRLSRTAGLLPARPGVIWLAVTAGVSVVPTGIYGHEYPGRQWRRLRRPTFHIRFGRPVSISPEDDPGGALTSVMSEIAQQLPPQYRGVYAGD